MDFNNYKNILEQKNQLKKIIQNNGKKITFSKGETIILGGNKLENVYYLDKGRVRFTLLGEDGKNHILSVKNEGILIGGIPVLEGKNSTNCNVISETKSEVYEINHNTFYYLIDSSIVFRYYLINGLVSSMRYEANKNIKYKLYSKKDVFYSYIANNIDKQCIIEDNWYNVYPQYSQQEYADFFNFSRMTIYTIIKQLCDEGKIRIINNNIQIKIKDSNSIKID